MRQEFTELFDMRVLKFLVNSFDHCGAHDPPRLQCSIEELGNTGPFTKFDFDESIIVEQFGRLQVHLNGFVVPGLSEHTFYKAWVELVALYLYTVKAHINFCYHVF